MLAPTPWSKNPPPFTLEQGEAHIWRIPLEFPKAIELAAHAHLSKDELERTHRYVFEKHQRRFAIGRAAQRLILAQYLPLSAANLVFKKGEHGKPYLADIDFEFNVSNTHELALVALYKGKSVGVDIEYKRKLTHGESIARHHFSPEECRKLSTAQGSAWAESFFNCWTRKEAFIKVTGEGLKRDLSSFEVSLLPHEDAQLHRVDDDHHPQARWQMRAFDPGDGYAGALCVDGPLHRIHFVDFDPAIHL